jgi:hypothetical protein
MPRDVEANSRWPGVLLMAPRHYNPPPMFGLRVPLSRTAKVVAALVALAPDGIEVERLPALLYMTDVIARQYLGRPLTDHEWRRSDLTASPTKSVVKNV